MLPCHNFSSTYIQFFCSLPVRHTIYTCFFAVHIATVQHTHRYNWRKEKPSSVEGYPCADLFLHNRAYIAVLRRPFQHGEQSVQCVILAHEMLNTNLWLVKIYVIKADSIYVTAHSWSFVLRNWASTAKHFTPYTPQLNSQYCFYNFSNMRFVGIYSV